MAIRLLSNESVDGNITVNGGQILTPGGVNLALNPNTGTVSVGGVLDVNGTGSSTFAGDLTLANGNSLRWTSDDVRIEATTASDNMKFYVAAQEIFKLEQAGTLATFAGNVTVGSNSLLYVNDEIRIGTNIGATNETGIIKQGGSSYGVGIFTWGDSAPVQIGGGSVLIQKESGGAANLTVSGNVGIGVTSPNAKLSLAGGSNINSQNSILYIDTNSYYATAADRYITTSTAARYIQLNGSHIWSNAPSGTAGNAISFTERMRIDSSGNVGIGTASPVQPLQVNGQVLFRTTTAEGGKNRFQLIPGGSSDAANLYLYYGNSGDGTVSVRINAQGSSYFNGGAVGIGTTAPFSDLSINVGANAPSSSGNMASEGLTVHNGAGGRAVQIGVNESGAYNYIQSSYVNNSNVAVNLAFFTGASERVRIDTSGNVGIGQSPSTAKLEVAGEARVYTGSNLGYWGVDAGNSYVYFGTNSSGYGLSFQTSGAEKMRIKSDGTIQIGATAGYTTISEGAFFTKGGGDMFTANLLAGAAVTPMFRLQRNDVEKYNIGLDASDNLAFINASGDAKMSVDSSGDILIKGTNNPYTGTNRGNITLNGSAGNIIAFTNNTSGKGFIFHDSTDLKILNAIAGNLIFSTNSTERMRIDSSGNVGIGTTSPSGKLNVFGATGLPATSGTTFTGTMRLQVAGYGTTLDFGAEGPSTGKQWIQATDAGDLSVTYPLLLNPNGGNVGIGTTSPETKLEVRGSIASGTGTAPTQLTYDTSGLIRAFVHNFNEEKNTASARNVTFVDVSGLGNFHQAMFYVQYGTRLQSVSDSTTGAVVRTYGVNRFNGGTLQVTETNAIAGSSNSVTHALITVEIVSNTQYRLRVEFSSTLGPSSFVTGLINGFAVGDSFPSITFAEGAAGM